MQNKKNLELWKKKVNEKKTNPAPTPKQISVVIVQTEKVWQTTLRKKKAQNNCDRFQCAKKETKNVEEEGKKTEFGILNFLTARRDAARAVAIPTAYLTSSSKENVQNY